MKRATKVLVLLLIAVFLLGVFSGCGLFGRNTDKYRATTAFTVGDEKITIGKLIDTYNNYYNTYYSYITQGYITADYVLELAMDALYTQYMKVDAYKNIEGVPTYTHAGTNFANQEYLSDEEYAFTLRYIKYVIFGGLDSVVESYASADYTLAAEEEEDKMVSLAKVKMDDEGNIQVDEKPNMVVSNTVKTREEIEAFPYRPRLVLNGVGDIPPADCL